MRRFFEESREHPRVPERGRLSDGETGREREKAQREGLESKAGGGEEKKRDFGKKRTCTGRFTPVEYTGENFRRPNCKREVN